MNFSVYLEQNLFGKPPQCLQKASYLELGPVSLDMWLLTISLGDLLLRYINRSPPSYFPNHHFNQQSKQHLVLLLHIDLQLLSYLPTSSISPFITCSFSLYIYISPSKLLFQILSQVSSPFKLLSQILPILNHHVSPSANPFACDTLLLDAFGRLCSCYPGRG